jgi:hypothetical protein
VASRSRVISLGVVLCASRKRLDEQCLDRRRIEANPVVAAPSRRRMLEPAQGAPARKRRRPLRLAVGLPVSVASTGS